MMKRQYIVTVGWERCLVFYEDAGSDKRPVAACRIVPGNRLAQQQAALHQGHSSDILTAAMQVLHTFIEQNSVSFTDTLFISNYFISYFETRQC